MVRLEKVKREF
jgi:hypothetical protein